ncbi:hypothetical protein Ptr902_13139 [Pyrenophora tritici-repentis]|nr:hypothetical protein Ptr902_13139 [Pyrenophora tritici-repentis]
MSTNSPRVTGVHDNGLPGMRVADSRNKLGDGIQDTQHRDTSETSDRCEHGGEYSDEESDGSDMSETGGDVGSDTMDRSEKGSFYESNHRTEDFHSERGSFYDSDRGTEDARSETGVTYDSDHRTEDVHSEYGSEYSSSAESMVDAESVHLQEQQHQPSGITYNQKVLYAPNKVAEAAPANQTPNLVIKIHQERYIDQQASASRSQSHTQKDIFDQDQRIEADDVRHEQELQAQPTNDCYPQQNGQRELEQAFSRQLPEGRDVRLQNIQAAQGFPRAAVPSSEPDTATDLDFPESNFDDKSEYSADYHNGESETRAYEAENHRPEIAMRRPELTSNMRESEEQRFPLMNVDTNTITTEQRNPQVWQEVQSPTASLENLEINTEFAQRRRFLSHLKEKQRQEEIAAEEEALQLYAQHRETRQDLMRLDFEEGKQQRAANARRRVFETAQAREEYQEEEVDEQVTCTLQTAQAAYEKGIHAAQEQSKLQALEARKAKEEEQQSIADEEARRNVDIAARRAEEAWQIQEEDRQEAER